MQSIQQLRQNSISWTLRNILLPLGDIVFGQKMMHRLKYLEKAQWWHPEPIAREQDRALSELVAIVYHDVAYYREEMDRAGVKPSDIQTPKDLQKLPIVTKEIIRTHYPERITRPTDQKVYEARTSGSTGQNFSVLEDSETAGWYRAAFLLSLEWAGWKIGEPHVQTGMTLHRSQDRKIKDKLLQCHYISAFDLSDKHLETTLELIDKYHIHHLWGYPGSIYILAKHALKRGWNQPLRTIVTWGDNLYSNYRKTIELAFGKSLYDTYGCAEGVQIAAQCEQGSYHLHSLDAVIEFLDENNNPVKRGELGKIIVTRLHPGPMPLLRYQIGDVGIEASEQLCSCGRGFSRMDSIQGRDTDIIITPSGNRLIVHFFTGILEFFPEIDTFQVIQEDPRTLIIRIVPTSQYATGSGDRIISHLKAKGAEDMNILVELVQEIPLPSSGKRRFVISKIRK